MRDRLSRYLGPLGDHVVRRVDGREALAPLDTVEIRDLVVRDPTARVALSSSADRARVQRSCVASRACGIDGANRRAHSCSRVSETGSRPATFLSPLRPSERISSESMPERPEIARMSFVDSRRCFTFLSEPRAPAPHRAGGWWRAGTPCAYNHPVRPPCARTIHLGDAGLGKRDRAEPDVLGLGSDGALGRLPLLNRVSDRRHPAGALSSAGARVRRRARLSQRVGRRMRGSNADANQPLRHVSHPGRPSAVARPDCRKSPRWRCTTRTSRALTSRSGCAR